MGFTQFRISNICLATLVAAVLALTACGGGYHTVKVNGNKKVYSVDDQGNKNLVYEVDPEGNTRVYDPEDPMYRQHLAEQQRERKHADMLAERNERFKQAPKRRSGDPIYVTIHPVKLDDRLKKAQHSKDAIDKQVRKEFKSDKVIRVVSKKQKKRNEWVQIGKALKGDNPYDVAPAADIEVASRAYLKEIYGINKKTGKPDKMPAVVFEATIKSNYLPAEYSVRESGHIFRNEEVTRRFVSRIKHIIKQQIGPTLPARQVGYRQSK